MSSLLNTQNPEAPVFQTEALTITVLGGVKLGGLDKLRVTLKIEKEGSSLWFCVSRYSL